MNTQVNQLYTPLFHYVRKRINNPEDAEDLTQEIFLKLSNSNSDNIDNLRSWIFTIAKNTITDYYRKKKVYSEEVDDNTFVDDHNDNNAVVELTSCITSYVNQLPEEYRKILKLSELEKVPQKEIAERMNLNYATVRSKIQRGRKKIKDLFSQCCTIQYGADGGILDYESKKKCNNPGPNYCGKETC